MREDEWYNNLDGELCAMPGTFAVFALGMEGTTPQWLRLVCDYLDLCDDEHSSLQEKFIHAFFKNSASPRRPCPSCYTASCPCRSCAPQRSLARSSPTTRASTRLLAAKRRLADYLPEESERDKEAQEYLWLGALWAIWGKASGKRRQQSHQGRARGTEREISVGL